MHDFIDEEWLEAIGFKIGSMHATLELPSDGGMPVTLWLTPKCGGSDGDPWDCALTQDDPEEPGSNGIPADHVLLTSICLDSRAKLLDLLRVLGAQVEVS